MGAWCCLGGLDAMARAAVAAGNRQRGSVMGPQQLQPVHRGLVHRALAGLTTCHLGEREVGPAVCWPGIGGIAQLYFFLGFGFDLLLPALRAAAAAFLPAAV